MKIVIIDDHQLFLSGLKNLINCVDDFEVVETFKDPKNILPYLNSKNVNIDLIITDLNMPDINGLDLIRLISQHYPTIKIAVMTMYFSEYLIELLGTYDVKAYILKSDDEIEFEKALREIKLGNTFYSKSLIKYHQKTDLKIENSLLFKKEYSLSKREFEIFDLIVKNFSSQQIAESLFISKETVWTCLTFPESQLSYLANVI